MSNLCHQIISEFLHTVITYEHELELLRRQLAENENFDIFYSFQSIDKLGNGVLDSNDIKALYDVHGIKTKKEDIEFLNKKDDASLNITYKEFMNLLLSSSSVTLREKCLRKGGSKAQTPSQENDRVVEDKILELFNKKIEYGKALQVFSTYDISPIDLRDSLFECCEESRGFLEHRKLEALMKKNNYTFDKSDFATIKRLASTFLETKISPAQFVAFMLPQADVISLTHHGVYPTEHRHSQRSHTQETFRNSHMAQIQQQEMARKSSTPQPELRYSHLNVDLTSPNSNNRPSIFPSLEPDNAERAAFYADRPHLMEKLGTSPNFKGTRKTVKFSVDEENRYNNFEDSVNTRPSFGSGLQSINSNGRNQPELLIKDHPLSVNDLPSSDNRHTAGSHIFESHVKTVSNNKENAARHVRESHNGRPSQKSPSRISHETPYSAKSQQIKDQVILREANKIKNQYDDKLAGKRELLNLSKQKRADSSVVITGHNKSPNKGNKRGIVEGVSTVDSVYFDGNRTMNMSVRNVNYTMSSKYDNSRSGKKSVSPDKKYVTFENGWKLTDYTGGNNKYGKMPSLEVARINSQNDGLTELRNLAAADEYGQKVIDDAYLNRLHYILDRKNAERDAHALKVERTVSFQPAAQSPSFEPNYQQERMGDYRDYAGRRDISGFIQEIGRNSPTKKDSPSRSNSKNFMQFRDSPKRDLRLNNEVSVMSDINTLENLKIGSYRFGNNFYDRMLP